MKKLIVTLLVWSFVLAGVSLAAAGDCPGCPNPDCPDCVCDGTGPKGPGPKK